ncbi:MAG: XRE family transcriptional regulator [Bacteroidetes bacterium GWF2_41_31]|nr:mobile mystery protein A [Bacteroidales bacterium]OFY50368.1 MAG: XRE family transcriptional regulator [Bacteroidetes bacterium GWF2_41_31]
MRNQRKLLLEQLDRKLKPFNGTEIVIIPDKGWINTIRTTINMTLKQLGIKLKMTKQGVKRIEESEAAGTITIKSLKEVGNALEMKFVYGFVPFDGSIDSLLNRRSKILAEKIILRTNHNMMLEDQAIGKGNLKSAIEELSQEIKIELKKTIWD